MNRPTSAIAKAVLSRYWSREGSSLGPQQLLLLLSLLYSPLPEEQVDQVQVCSHSSSVSFSRRNVGHKISDGVRQASDEVEIKHCDDDAEYDRHVGSCLALSSEMEDSHKKTTTSVGSG